MGHQSKVKKKMFSLYYQWKEALKSLKFRTVIHRKIISKEDDNYESIIRSKTLRHFKVDPVLKLDDTFYKQVESM